METKKIEQLIQYIWEAASCAHKWYKALRRIEQDPSVLGAENTILETNKIPFNYQHLLQEARGEIRQSSLNCNDELSSKKYLYFLIKSYRDITFSNAGLSKEIDYVEQLLGTKMKTSESGKKFWFVDSGFDQILVDCHCYYGIVTEAPDDFLSTVCNEIGIKKSDLFNILYAESESSRGKVLLWRDPTFNDFGKFFSVASQKEEAETEILNIEFKSTTQKLAWLYELGVIEQILRRSAKDNIVNYTKAANLLSSISGINVDTARKCLEAIYKPNEGNKRNHPFNNEENKAYIELLKAKFKLS